MENGQLNWIAGFIWNIADDVLRERLSRLSWEFDLRPGDSGSTLCDGLLCVNGFA